MCPALAKNNIRPDLLEVLLPQMQFNLEQWRLSEREFWAMVRSTAQ